MPINEKLIIQEAAAATGDADAADGLVLHLDANDEDSIESGGANTGNGSGTWFDIANHDLIVPRIAPSTNLILDLDFSNTGSYSGSGPDVEDVSENNPEADGSINGSGTFASDTRGYYDFGTLNSNFISIGSLGDFTTTGDLSFEVWVYPQGSGEQTIFATSHSSTSAGYLLSIADVGGRIYNFSDRPTGSYARSTTSQVINDQWQHIVVTWDVSEKKFLMYVDGTITGVSPNVGSGTATTPTDSNDVLKINAINTGYGHSGWAGRFNSLRIYNRVLTASEVAQNFRADCFLSYSSIYSTDLEMNLDAANYTSGAWADSAGSNNGTITNAVFDKELGNYFEFDGSGDFVTVAHNTDLDFELANGDRTFAAWVQRGSTTNEQRVLSKGGCVTGYFLNYTTTTNVGYYFYDFGSTSYVRSGTSVSNGVGNWDYVVVTWDLSAKSFDMYVNGTLSNVTQVNNTGTPSSTTSNLLIGHDDTGGGCTAHNFWDGRIAVVKIYTSKLTSAQVAQNYLATKNDYPNGFNGDIQGPTFQGGSTPYHFDFNGSTNYVDAAYTTLGDRDFTLTMYIKFDDLSAERYIWNKYLTGGSGEFGMIVQSPASSDKIVWQMYDTGNGTAINITTSTSLTTTPYYHLAFVYVKETSAVIYLNGSSDGTDTYTGSNPFAQNSDQIRIGRYQTNSTSHDGEIGQVKIFDKALSASEVLAEFNATKTIYGL